MGVWGPGNFDEDTAEEHLGEVILPLLEQIEQTAGNPAAMEPDEYESVAMMCNIEILVCLAEHLGRKDDRPHLPIRIPAPEIVGRWQSAYLRVWDGYIDGLGASPEHREQRRAVIVRTFERFVRLADLSQRPTD